MYKMERQKRDEQFRQLMDEYIEDRRQSMTNQETKYTRNRFTSLELESRFGTKPGTRIQRNNYTSIVEKLKSLGWTISQDQYFMRVTPEYVDPNTGLTKQSNIRAEITGIDAIRDYCRSNDLDIGRTTFVQKFPVKKDDERLVVDYPDFGFRIALSTERTLSKQSKTVQTILQTWKDNKKTFRVIQRVSFQHPTMNTQIDLSIVRSSTRQGRGYKPTYTVTESGVMTNPEAVELESEVIDDKVRREQIFDSGFTSILTTDIKRTNKQILSAIQQTNYPISLDEQKRVLMDYMKLMHKDTRTPRTKDFCGPSSISLELKNVVPLDENVDTPNIRMPYTVTDKADGKRKLMYIDGNGKVYLIDTNMNVQFTGAVTENEKLFRTLLDGEHILHNKKGQFMNLYAAFDIYFVRDKDVRSYGFTPMPKDKTARTKFRYHLLNSIMKNLDLKSVQKGKGTPLRVQSKTFCSSSGEKENTIFRACQTILRKVNDGEFEYETDGLIFTPMNTGVGMDKIGDKPINTKRTWMRSFKWKPPEFNTVDFLLTFDKEQGQDVIESSFNKGDDAGITQYKVATLRVGFDENVHGYLNPCERIMEDDMPKYKTTNDEYGEYKPVPFIPSNPYDANASRCNLSLKQEGTEKVIVTEEGEIIEDQTIVECRYDKTREKGWRWIPLRVRYDKTAEYRRGEKNFGNAYHVAESVWRSIHQPVTETMITTGRGIPPYVGEYTETPMNAFERYVSNVLYRASQPGDTLAALDVGGASLLPEWIHRKLSFVLGVDDSRNALFHRIHGACANYLNAHKRYKSLPSALFAQANLEQPWTEAFSTDKGKQISQAIFGRGTKDRKLLGETLYKQYGVVQDGFQIVNHMNIERYFRDTSVLSNFIQTLQTITRKNGIFIGTCLDGQQVFDALHSTPQGGAIYRENWRIQKEYDANEFVNDETSLGYEIIIEQDSVRKSYLMNFEYFTRMMEKNGFILLENSSELNIPKSTGTFRDLYKLFGKEMKEQRAVQTLFGDITKMDKEIREFMMFHRYFVFVKRNDIVTREPSKPTRKTIKLKKR